MDKALKIKIKKLKSILKKDGFIIDGVFGSIARGDYTNKSDIDLLYHLEEPFFTKYQGFKGFAKIEEIKEFLKKELKRDIDLAPTDNLSNTAKKYILKDLKSV